MKRTDGRGDPLPNGAVTPRYRIVYPTPGNPLELVLVNPTWDGMYTHWVPGSTTGKPRTIICDLPDECVCSTKTLPHKWHGYIGAINLRTGLPVILTSTKRGISSLLNVCLDADSFRGMTVILKRLSDHPSSAVVATESPKRWLQKLPDPIPVDDSLETLYGRAAIQRWRERTTRKDGAQ